MLEVIGDIILTNQYWDCECERNFIHPVEIVMCPVCGSDKDDQPDSRINEVLQLGFSLPDADLSSVPDFAAKQLGIKWLKKHVKLDEWPEDDWTVLSPEFPMRIFIDNDGNSRATIFPAEDDENDFRRPIEVA